MPYCHEKILWEKDRVMLYHVMKNSNFSSHVNGPVKGQ